jgi:hypothetical protein
MDDDDDDDDSETANAPKFSTYLSGHFVDRAKKKTFSLQYVLSNNNYNLYF